MGQEMLGFDVKCQYFEHGKAKKLRSRLFKSSEIRIKRECVVFMAVFLNRYATEPLLVVYFIPFVRNGHQIGNLLSAKCFF